MKFGLFLLFTFVAAAQSERSQSADAHSTNLPAQKIGANDLIAVSVYDSPELTRTVRAGADGMIRMPMLKQKIKVQGLMPSEIETAIAEALKKEDIIIDAFVTVTVAEYHSRPISIMGAVRKPMTFQAVGPLTLLEALSRTEGLTPDAGPEIFVTRTQPGPNGVPTPLVQRIESRSLMDASNSAANIQLIGGEEIRVPEQRKVFVVGNVRKPGAFAVQDGISTVLKSLALAEGLTPYAGKQAFIYRREGGGMSNSEIPVELRKIMNRQAPDVTLAANDILYIPDSSGPKVALEKILTLGSAAVPALIYTGIR
ncbi:MAG TPA: polysaccharide biosynthesis/export family protein [Bryobacteraceae bacterium]|nr:polysaccharide biosynthesis/export family protein [Bryobacteraceae bacterium]